MENHFLLNLYSSIRFQNNITNSIYQSASEKNMNCGKHPMEFLFRR